MPTETRCPTCNSFLASASDSCPRCSRVGATQSIPDDLAPVGPRSTPRVDGTRPVEPTAREPELPERIGRFLIRGWVGEGSFAEVYRAYDPQLDREVALKVAKPGTLGTARRVKRFLREAKAAGNLRHPNIVPLYETGEDGGRHFLVSAFIRGTTLGTRIDATPGGLPLKEAAQVVRKLADSLGYAHGEGIVHRDVKPDNVMVDEKGEPLLMDFGLAARAESEEGEERLTQQGIAVGTPAYMAPEQAKADLSASIGPAADQYALGCTLYELLTSQTPFSGPPEVQLLLHQTQPAPSPRKLRAEVPRDLETICRKCLEKEPGQRYADCQAVADDLRRWLDGEPISARRPGLAEQFVRGVKRNPGRAAAVAAVVLVVVGALVAADQVRKQRQDDQYAADQRLNDQKLAAEKQRADDLTAAEEKRKQTRAESLVQALATADTAGVPRLIDDLKEYRDLTGLKLHELAAQPVGTKPGLHGRLALLTDEPNRANELAVYLLVCKPEELLPIRDALKPHAAAVKRGLWMVLTDPKADSAKRVRAASALAGLAADEQVVWAAVAPLVTEAAVRANPVEFVTWAQALESVGGLLVPALVKRYPEARARIESGKLAVTELVAEASAFDLTANLLARYTTDPAELAELALIADPRHYTLFAGALNTNKAGVVPVLKSELKHRPAPPWAIDGLGASLAAVGGLAAVAEWLDPDAVLIKRGKRRGHAAAVLLTLGEVESVWPLFQFPKDGDPTARSYLIQRLASVGADPRALMQRFEAEGDVSAKRALLVALGDFPPELVAGAEREALAAKLLVLYREHPDSGLHSAIDWLLRQKWSQRKALAAIDAELAKQARAKVLARDWAGAVSPGALGAVVGPQLPAPRVAEGKDWFVNGEGQTFAVVRGPVEFTLGSPESEPGRFAVNEPPHPKRISRTFAVATREVTVEQFLRFRPKHDWIKRYSPGEDTPAVGMTWYEAAEYCNWLSAREGIPLAQWCYEPNEKGQYHEGMRMKVGHLKLTGYRLPTEAEWEFACRSGSVTARYHGRGEDLLPRYGWFVKNAEERAWAVGRLRPNELGLFDMLGNAIEWVEDPALLYVTGQIEDKENSKFILIDERMSRLLRGGSFGLQPVSVRCANRYLNRPGYRYNSYGFRPVRTLY